MKRPVTKLSTPCWGCGGSAQVNFHLYGKRAWCEECGEKYHKEIKTKTEKLARLKADLMFYRALTILERQGVNMYDYKEASEVVWERIQNDYKAFDSAPEIVACMELLRKRVRIKLHKKIAGVEVDFVLPEERIVLEIDGVHHKMKAKEDWERDRLIRSELGLDWEIIRIPAKHIEYNVQKLADAIELLYEKQQHLRANNCGILPDWYDRRSLERLNELKKIK